MKSTLKTALPIVLVVLMVFGITFMSQFTTEPPKPSGDGADSAISSLQPLVAGSAVRVFDPNSVDAVNRVFTGYFEVGSSEDQNRVSFFIRNQRPTPVRLSALTPSCTACTAARAAAIPNDLFQQYLFQTAISNLWGIQPKPQLDTAVAWQQLYGQLKWHGFAFNELSNQFELPAAPPIPEAEQWGLLELAFSIKSAGQAQPKNAWFKLLDTQNRLIQPKPFEFTVVCGAREPIELASYDYQLGELSASLPSQSSDIICLSATREVIPPPVLSVSENDPYVKLSTPQALTAKELLSLSQESSMKNKSMISYRSGYRQRFTVNRDADGKSMDVGPYEKGLSVIGGEGVILTKPYRVKLSGTVIGFLRLEKGSSIDFGTYDSNFLVKKDVRLWTDRKDVELEIQPELCQPTFLKLTLSKPSIEADRTYWSLSLQIPEKEGRRPPWDGYIYLRTKEKVPTTIRIPVAGHGR
jgi:hypothetical protein